MPHPRQPATYKAIAARLRELIETGELAPGTRFPSVREIEQRYHVAHKTAAAAYGVLRDEGAIETGQGGARVAVSTSGARERLERLRAGKGLFRSNERAEIVEVSQESDPRASVAQHFEPEDFPLIRREYIVTGPDGVRVTWGVSWVSGRFAGPCPRLLEPEPLPNGNLGEIADRTGRTVNDMPKQRSSGAATVQEAEMLQVDAGAPVLRERITCVSVDHDEATRQVLEYNEQSHPEGFWVTD